MAFFAQHRWLHHIYVPFAVGAFFAILDTTGAASADTDLVTLIARPIVSLMMIWLVLLPITATINAALQGKNIPLILRLTLSSLIGCFPLAILLPWLMLETGIAWQEQQDGWMPMAGYEEVFFHRYLQFLKVVPIIWVVLNWRWYRENEKKDLAETTDNAIQSTDTPLQSGPTPLSSSGPVVSLPGFVSRLSKPVGNAVWALKSEQHYVRVFGNEASDLMLYRLGDAIRDMDNIEGMQVHRSWWIARQGIQRVDTSGKNWEIILKNGEQVPVSRSYKQAFEQSGWHLQSAD